MYSDSFIDISGERNTLVSKRFFTVMKRFETAI